MAGPKKCPRCGILNEPEAKVCDCGLEFASGRTAPGRESRIGGITMACQQCSVSISRFFMFPGGLCKRCYANTAAGSKSSLIPKGMWVLICIVIFGQACIAVMRGLLGPA
jgi:hypothetical protein